MQNRWFLLVIALGGAIAVSPKISRQQASNQPVNGCVAYADIPGCGSCNIKL